MQTVVIVIHLMVVLAMIGVVLLQKSEGGGLGMGGGGGGGGFLSSRGTANVLTRATAIFAALFFATSLILSILAGFDRRPSSILQGGTPAGQGSGTLPPGSNPLDRFQTPAPSAPPAQQPPAPAGPQPPRSQ